MAHYDLLVIGTGPAGQKAAVQAAKLSKNVGIIERKTVVGGVCINTGTIPSKSFAKRCSISRVSSTQHLWRRVPRKKKIAIEDLAFRANHVIKHEIQTVQSQMARNQVDMFSVQPTFWIHIVCAFKGITEPLN